ncbi:hypothetical protein [Kribbella jejuensis]|uniref:Uncharacterized protein n=1 Tax=Kribbella jejuensis TaxID=236068 RepID=A0A542DB83_9ACTN|nr:hypothetical protein [Kribbella jejuensis]TQJ00333.1 hypothetical protein FB475_7330 [Kribbella jejuensis]
MASDSMVDLTIRTAGAVRHAPRLLRAWMTATETCVRDDTGMLLWLATDSQIAWVYDGQLTTSPPLDDNAAGEVVWWEPATEVSALRDLRSAALWLGAEHEPVPVVDDARLSGKEVDWFTVPHEQVRNLRIARDSATGTVMHISGTDPVHGDLLVEVTAIHVLPRNDATFQPQLNL